MNEQTFKINKLNKQTLLLCPISMFYTHIVVVCFKSTEKIVLWASVKSGFVQCMFATLWRVSSALKTHVSKQLDTE